MAQAANKFPSSLLPPLKAIPWCFMEEKVKEIEKSFAAQGLKGAVPIPTRTKQQGDWVIVCEVSGPGAKA